MVPTSFVVPSGKFAIKSLFSLFKSPETTSLYVPSPPADITRSTLSGNSFIIFDACPFFLVYFTSKS